MFSKTGKNSTKDVVARTSIYLPLRNHIFRSLWIAGLVSSSAVSAHDIGRNVGDEYTDAFAPSNLPDVDSGYLTLLPIHLSGRGDRRHGGSQETSVYHEPLARDRRRRFSCTGLAKVRQSLCHFGSCFPLRRWLCYQCSRMDRHNS